MQMSLTLSNSHGGHLNPHGGRQWVNKQTQPIRFWAQTTRNNPKQPETTNRLLSFPPPPPPPPPPPSQLGNNFFIAATTDANGQFQIMSPLHHRHLASPPHTTSILAPTNHFQFPLIFPISTPNFPKHGGKPNINQFGFSSFFSWVFLFFFSIVFRDPNWKTQPPKHWKKTETKNVYRNI